VPVYKITTSVDRVRCSIIFLWFAIITRFVSTQCISPCKLKHTFRSLDKICHTNWRMIYPSVASFSHKTPTIVISLSLSLPKIN
jgi:hypothetical protein